jgi:hypothetical protein
MQSYSSSYWLQTLARETKKQNDVLNYSISNGVVGAVTFSNAS